MPETSDAQLPTRHRIIIGDSRRMPELENESVHLMVTSPPYFNAPFDYEGVFKTYEEFLSLMSDCAEETYRVLAEGRIACVNCDDMLVKGTKYPIVADITRIFMAAGFRYRDKITWCKPEGYIRISRRSGVILQHPYPMYFYPDNMQESILLFQKGTFRYKEALAALRKDNRLQPSKIDVEEFQRHKWYLSVWNMTNVLPFNRLEKGIAAFPDELPYRIIRLFTFVGDTVLDPFLGSGTTTKVAKELRRNSIGYEINPELLPKIKRKIGYGQGALNGDDVIEVRIREREH